uniref:Na+/H+ antiporter NhaC family protein n=1 Tax=Caloramator sp. Dgby_cultured_2 TaxID=3029174 RepID=UPI0031584C25
MLGAIFAVIFQGKGFGDILSVLNDGYVSETGFKIVDDLLTRGGLQSMMYTVSLILCAMTFGGIMEKAGFWKFLLKSYLASQIALEPLLLQPSFQVYLQI